MKKTKLQNDFCNLINDGFGCLDIENGSASWCAGCLIQHIKEVTDDLQKLYEEMVSDHAKDKER